MFLYKLRTCGVPTVNTIIGIRFGGIELPFLAQRFLFDNADICTVKISTYTNSVVDIRLDDSKICNRNILVLDDNILTGRTLDRLVTELKTATPKNILFACIEYSSMKRYPQMIMDGHGVASTHLLDNICVVNQSCFTKISSSKSYKNKNGVFDKVKKEIQATLDSYKDFNFKI